MKSKISQKLPKFQQTYFSGYLTLYSPTEYFYLIHDIIWFNISKNGINKLHRHDHSQQSPTLKVCLNQILKICTKPYGLQDYRFTLCLPSFQVRTDFLTEDYINNVEENTEKHKPVGELVESE